MPLARAVIADVGILNEMPLARAVIADVGILNEGR
jgi:hypothetical protein